MNVELFCSHLSSLDNNYRERRYLLAVSGGIDSMTMFHLFASAGLSFAVVHCNFHLRNEESLRDHEFVNNSAMEAGCDFYVEEFDTIQFAQTNRLNIQDAARKLRYGFFNRIALEFKFDFVCTAHNRDDVVETLLMGLNRRGGLSVLAGIRESDRLLLRPMLVFSRKEIADYAAANMVAYVEDSSNESDKYLRNRIRHNVLPLIEQWLPGFSDRAASSVSYLQQSFCFLNFATEEALLQLGHPEKEGYDLLKLQNHSMAKPLLIQFLLTHGFRPEMAQTILDISDYSEPHRFISAEKILHVHRGRLILREKTAETDAKFWYIDSDLDTSDLPMKMLMEFTTVNHIEELRTDTETAFFCADEIKFPLLVRKWEAGERFVPLGMNHFKKIGDFFTDLKITVPERQSAYVMCSDIRTAWLIGYRIDQRFAVRAFPAKVLKIKLL
ncbi:MAG: tRNA lysidine(34) synthetase TilS [Bacteroidetes bacterium HGW-Bacteroidetes-6]|jgi:tRNA(Ile)-lysidine synthase|nr:MAG: tRNA lysidine(34) synthetase TilS [Bacteroidetes bacterium HGW-Bacteroidetes-6]